MSSFGGTVKLTGESEYRKALGEITTNLKVLNSEMKTVTSQYDKNDTSVQNLSSQNEVLNKKITEQQKAVDILSEALEKSKAETGENSNTTKDWQIKLNNAQAEMNKLNREVEGNKEKMSDATKNTNEESDALEEFGKEAEKSGESSLKLGDIIKANLISEAIVGGMKMLANGIKSIGSAMSETLTAGAQYADNILTLSAQTGLSTDTLEKYNAVAELTDVSMDTLTSSMSKNIKAMSEARNGSEKYALAYEQLGVSVTDAHGNLRDSETVYWETIDALKGINNETERDALAMELFGKKAQDLNTIIDLGSEGVAEYSQKAVDMGAVLGGKGLEALGNLDDQMQIFSSTTASTKNILASAFAPAMASALEGVNGLAGSVNGLISAIISGDEGGIEKAMSTVSEQVTAMVTNIGQSAPQIVQIAKDLISTLLQVIADNLPVLLEGGVEILSSMLDGISSNTEMLVSCILMVIETLLDAIIDNLDVIIEMGITLTLSLGEGLVKATPRIVAKIPQIVRAILNGFGEALGIGRIADIGDNIVKGIWQGISDASSWVLEKIKGFGDEILNGIKGFFGIHSPSRLFKDEVGKNLALGVGEGFADTMKDVSDEMNGAIPTEFDASMTAQISGGASASVTSFDGMVSAFKRALKEVKVVMDDKEMGGFVEETIERAVFA